MENLKRGLPVTIITGFLGSGKTTLLNHILNNQQGLRTAVLVNEFGEISIDSELIISSDGDMVELNNGCMCCTVRGDIVDSVLNLLERSDKLDYLVVETTGLADPLPIALTFLGPELRDIVRLDSIVTLVDASNFAPDLFTSEVAHNQIAYGDVLVLNKTDLVEAAELERLEARLREIRGDVRILHAHKSAVPLELILDTDLFAPPEADHASQADHDHDDEHDHAHAHHDHDHAHDHDCDEHCDHDHDHHDHANHLEVDGFSSVAFTSEYPLALNKFQDFLDHLPVSIFRAKGVLWFAESPDRHIFHLCGKRYTVDSEQWAHGSVPQTQLVVIGQHLDKAALLRQLEGCLKAPAKAKGFA